MYRRSFLAPALMLCLWAGAVSDLAWAQAATPAQEPGQSTPAPATPPSEKTPDAASQAPAAAPAATPAQQPAPAPGPAGAQPPTNSPPLVRFIELTFPTQGNQSV